MVVAVNTIAKQLEASLFALVTMDLTLQKESFENDKSVLIKKNSILEKISIFDSCLDLLANNFLHSGFLFEF